MPDVIIGFAEGPCIDSGLHLLKHAIWHATDPLIPNFLEEQITIGLHNNKIFLDISGQVHQLMKLNSYKTCVAFSNTNFLACACNCQSGSQCHNRHVCIHTLAKIYQLSLLLFDGLAQNMLIKLRVRLSDERLTKNQDELLQKSINNLMHAAGVYSHKMTPLSSLDMLSFFTMSTDKFKPPLGAQRQQDLGLIHNIRLIAPEK